MQTVTLEIAYFVGKSVLVNVPTFGRQLPENVIKSAVLCTAKNRELFQALDDNEGTVYFVEKQNQRIPSFIFCISLNQNREFVVKLQPWK